MPITIVSFGHLHGAPPQAHLVADLRGHFRNPAPDLDIEVTFPDPRVVDQVRSTAGIAELVASLAGAARAMADQGGETSLAVGCAGGNHRAPTVADQVAEVLQEQGHTVRLVHRDLPEASSTSPAEDETDIDDPIEMPRGGDFALAPLTRSGEDPDQARARLEALTEAWRAGFTAPDLSRALADEQGLTRSRGWVLAELRRLETAGRLWQDDDGRWSPAA